MTLLLDSSVILASLIPDEPRHRACDALLAQGGHKLYAHGLNEVFAVLSGGRMGHRLRPSLALRLIEGSVLPSVDLVHLTGRETLAAMAECERRGVRGGAVYDLMHLAVARKVAADALVTLDLRDFEALSRPGDPSIRLP